MLEWRDDLGKQLKVKQALITLYLKGIECQSLPL